MNQICGGTRLDEAIGAVGAGTGSKPDAPSGWQRERRLNASTEPRMTPNRRTASAAYSEQDGTNRHEPANCTENNSLYALIRARAPPCGMERRLGSAACMVDPGHPAPERAAEIVL